YHGEKKSDWVDSVEAYCAGDGNAVVTFELGLESSTASSYIIGGNEYEFFMSASISGDDYTFAEDLTWIINGEEIADEPMTTEFCMLPTKIMNAVGEPSVVVIDSFVPETIHIGVGETVNIADYYKFLPKEHDAVISYAKYSEYFDKYFTVSEEEGTVTGVSETDDSLPVVVKANYTETLSDGTEFTFRNEYKVNVMVYENVEAKPETYSVTLDGEAYTTARPGDKVCIYSEDEERILTNVAADGIEITKEDNPYSTGYGCFIFTMPESDVALTGTWEAIPVYYRVQFSMNGVATNPATQKILSGGKVTEPEVPTIGGLTFGGWYKDEECTQHWDFDANTVSENMTLYALWTHVHDYASAWLYDGTKHWKACRCGDITESAEHTPDHEGGATEEYAILCSVCGYVMEEKAGHEYSDTWSTDATKHWKECVCGAKSEEGEHTAGDWIVDEEATADKAGKKHKECTQCGYMMEEEDIPKTCVHSFTEKIADTDHYVRGSGSDCLTPYRYYYDCAYCDEWSLEHIWVSSEYGGHDWDEDSHCSVCDITFYHVNVGGCDITSQN
ncbi:MAG: InlB B-repeat-containing protein, partial [Lachnospiraceae bacterium]|nr:InlB B-repeat-containing protein [Lachnospiraceae bacterium]